MDCIEYVILGPEFGTSELDEIISHTEYKIEFNTLDTRRSIGTGIIRSK